MYCYRMRHWSTGLAASALLALGAPCGLAAQRATLQPSPAFGGAEVIHEKWTVADGLPVNSINDLLQSKDGYLWAATFDGLVRFDGVTFTVFNSANSPGLPSNRIVRIRESERGDLWLQTEQVDLIRRRAGRFTTVVRSSCLNSYEVPVVHAAGHDWVGGCEGLMRVDGDSLVPVRRDLLRDSVAHLLRRRDGTLSIGTSRGMVRLRLAADGSASPLSAPQDSALAHRRITAQFETPDGRLWVATDLGVWYDRNGWRRVPMASGPEMRAVHTMWADPRGRGVLLYGLRIGGTIALATDEHVTVLDSGPPIFKNGPLWSSTTTWWHARRSTLKQNGVPVLTLGPEPANGDAFVSDPLGISAGVTDSEGSVWLGTFAGGLHRIKPTLVRTISEPEGLRSRNAYGVYADRTDGVWVGSLGRGFSRIDAATGRVEGARLREFDGKSVRTFLESRDGTLWLGSESPPTALYRCTRVPQLQCTAERLERGTRTDVHALHEDPDGRLWIGVTDGVLRREQGRLTRVDPASGAPTQPVRAFARTRDGALWMGTNGAGLVRYREGGFQSVTTADGLPSDLVRALHVDTAGMLWIGTEGRGLARLDPTAWTGNGPTPIRRQIVTLSQKQGLFDETIHEILADDFGRLWMSSNRGLFWIAWDEANAVLDGRLPSLRSTSYTERDGMRNSEGNGGFQPSGARTSDGRLWFATQDGVAIVDPSAIAPDTVPPPIVIEQVVAGDSTLIVADSIVRLSPAQRDIRIDFTALTFLQPRNVRFRYRLDGYNDAWVDNDTRRSAFFTKLPPGTYTFRVQATKPGQTWRDSPARLTVVVQPRVVETPWFRGLGALGLLTLLLVTLQRRSRAAVARARELEQLVTDRTLTLRDREQQLERQNRQLETQADELQLLDQARSRFFANVSHELRTPLTLMIAPLDRLREEAQVPEQGRRWLDLAQRNARRLLELVNQLLDVAKLEAGAMRLSPRRFDICTQLRSAAEAFRLPAERKQLQLLVDAPAQCHVTLDRDAVEKIVGNLLSNAVKFTPPEGTISLALRREPTAIVISVSNSGPAIPPAQLALVFERFYQVDESNTTVQPGTGIGLSLVKELVELQGGSVRATSTEQCTTFVVQLPVPDATGRDGRATDSWQNSGPIPVDVSGLRDDRELDIPTLLVVDDSDDMRAFVRDHFAARFRVIDAADGLEALALAKSQLPDVIISDVMMPRLDGRELVRRLRNDPDTEYLAIILLTAQAEHEQRIAGLETGADDYLGKPFEMRELDVRVRNLIAARRRLQVRFGSVAIPNAAPDGNAGVPDLSITPSVAAPAPLTLPAGDDALSHDDLAYRDRVLDAIRERLGDADFGVTELANAVAQDRTYLFRRVRHVTGLSPSELLRRMRVEEGARLLLTHTGSVADVAFSVGFRSVSHFFRCFNERYGVTPSEYRLAGAGVGGKGGA
jgi:signal transduction histidine kinase/ligand-binding sensor domain-containing protein/AraC-like DNA-binding protein/ActR/RegA family two-component response regulator